MSLGAGDEREELSKGSRGVVVRQKAQVSGSTEAESLAPEVRVLQRKAATGRRAGVSAGRTKAVFCPGKTKAPVHPSWPIYFLLFSP